MPQLKSPQPQLKILQGAVKIKHPTCHNEDLAQINFFFYKKAQDMGKLFSKNGIRDQHFGNDCWLGQHTPVSASNKINLLHEHSELSQRNNSLWRDTQTTTPTWLPKPYRLKASCHVLELLSTPDHHRWAGLHQHPMLPPYSREPAVPIPKPPRAAHLVSTGLYDLSPLQKS